ncbi:MAG: hypothetical protein ACRELF_09005, partial [Gemmataceae bacterium]
MPPNPLDRLAGVLAEGEEAFFKDKLLLDALAKLAENDPAEFQCARAKVKGASIGIRSLDSALAPLRQKLRADRPPLTSAGEYRVAAGRIVHLRPTKDGPVESPLCNFAARIVSQVTHDDGAERSIRLAIEGQLADGTPLPPCEVAADKFGWMEWVIPSWGTRAVVNAGASTKDHLRAAMQLLSGNVPRREVFAHLGWRQVDGRWVYLHAGGAIGEDGAVDGVEVSPPPALARYLLPAPPAGDDLRRAVAASLRLLDLAPPRLAFPLLAAVYRAPLGCADFSVFLVGRSGVFKSEASALAQQHHGAGLDRCNLPGNWSSTANSLEAVAFACKDGLLVVDDFKPSGSTHDVSRLHQQAERLFRAQGNGAGRGRMRRDGSLAPDRPPRGLILSTGEEIPRGESLRARLFITEVVAGDIDPAKLTLCQSDAAKGLSAASMAGFIRWLAPRHEEICGRLSADRAKLRDTAAVDGHARTSGIVADLAIGLQHFLDFARKVGAIDDARRAELWGRGWSALCDVGQSQGEYVRASDPVDTFLRLLSASLASGRAHVAAVDGSHPEAAGAWGWRQEVFRDGPEWRPQGKRVGWIDGEQLYLEPEASYAAAQSMASEQGESLTVSPPILRKRMKERGILASTGETSGRTSLTVRRVVEGNRREIIHLRSSTLFSGKHDQHAHYDQTGEHSGENGHVSRSCFDGGSENMTTKHDHFPAENGGDGHSGHAGHVFQTAEGVTGGNNSERGLPDADADADEGDGRGDA